MKNEEQWKKKLPAETYHVMREKGTEKSFTGKYYRHKGNGTYLCAACGNALFSSDTKYESGTGWPSFYASISKKAVDTEIDKSHGQARVEVHCAQCGGHLGHIFEDGPEPTGKRYCINSASLVFKKK